MKTHTLPALVGSLFPLLAVAQTNQTDETIAFLDEVVVESAYISPVTLDNMGSSITVLDQRDFLSRNAQTVSDVLQTVPSLAITASGGRGTLRNVHLRGMETNFITVIIDGVKINPASGEAFDFSGLPLSNIEQIEILRGGQSALWGSGAVAGVIYITTKSGKNADKPFNADVQLGYGSEQAIDTSANLYGRKDSLYYSLSMDSHRSDGISAYSEKIFHYIAEDGTAITTGGDKETDSYQRNAATLKLGYDWGNAGVELMASHTNQHSDFDPSDASVEMTQANVSLSGFVGDEADLLQHRAYLNRMTSDSEYNSGFIVEGERRAAGYQVDVNFDREGDTMQSLSAAVEYQKDTQDSNSMTSKNAILEYRLFNDSDHALGATLRHDNNSQFENALSYRLSGGYRLNDNFRLHGSFGKAVKNPTMAEYYGFSSTWKANTSLRPEKSIGGDVGILIESGDGRHQLDMTYFHNHVDDLIVTNASFDGSENVDGTSKVRGFELAYNAEINDSLDVYANYTYTKAQDSTGTALIRRPKHKANVGLGYQVNDALNTTVNAQFAGKRMDSYYDDAFVPHAVEMPSYTLFNIGANYQVNEYFNVTARVNNIFDRQYENVVGYGQPERTFYLGIKGSF